MIKTEDRKRMQQQIAEAAQSIDEQKLNHDELTQMAAFFAVGYFDQKKLIETQEKTIDVLISAASNHEKIGEIKAVSSQKSSRLTELLPTLAQKFLEQAEAIDAISPFNLGGQSLEVLSEKNQSAFRILAGLKLQNKRNASRAVSMRPDIRLRNQQKHDFWDTYFPIIRASGCDISNVRSIKNELTKHDLRCLQIKDPLIKKWAKEDGVILRGGRPKSKN